MKLQQLRYLVAVAEHDLNISAAADSLYTSQPGVSKQLRLLEDELGFSLFQRNGKSLHKVTPAGKKVLQKASTILREVRNIQGLAKEFHSEDQGELSIATTHTQARYVLPPVIKAFRDDWPNVKFHLHQGTSEQISDMLKEEQVDLAIASGREPIPDSATTIPCYRWQRSILVPREHELTSLGKPVSLEDLSKFQLITYSFSLGADSSLLKAFHSKKIEPNVVLTARDADVIKTYVKLGMGVGIIAEMAYEPDVDTDLVAIDVSHLLEDITTWVAFREDTLLRGYAKDFISRFSEHMKERCPLQS